MHLYYCFFSIILQSIRWFLVLFSQTKLFPLFRQFSAHFFSWVSKPKVALVFQTTLIFTELVVKSVFSSPDLSLFQCKNFLLIVNRSINSVVLKTSESDLHSTIMSVFCSIIIIILLPCIFMISHLQFLFQAKIPFNRSPFFCEPLREIT